MEALPSTPALHAASVEFYTDGTVGGFTNAFNPAAVAGLTQTATGVPGMQINLPGTGGAISRLLGYYTSTFPTNDFSVWSCIEFQGPGISNSTGGLCFMQGSGGTDDIYMLGVRAATGGNSASVRLFAQYSTFTSDAFLSGSAMQGRLFVAARYDVNTREVTSWLGESPHAMTNIDTRTLTNAATLLGFLGQGANTGAGTAARMTVRFIRVYEETYSATELPTYLTGATRYVS